MKQNMIFFKSLQKKIPKKFSSFPLFNKVVFVGKIVHLRYPIKTLTKHGREERNAAIIKLWSITTDHIAQIAALQQR